MLLQCRTGLPDVTNAQMMERAIVNRHLKSMVIRLAKIGTAWWLLHKIPGRHPNEFEARTPEDFGFRVQPPQESIDDMVEASFPASDPTSWTPVSGTGRCS